MLHGFLGGFWGTLGELNDSEALGKHCILREALVRSCSTCRAQQELLTTRRDSTEQGQAQVGSGKVSGQDGSTCVLPVPLVASKIRAMDQSLRTLTRDRDSSERSGGRE